MQQIKQRVFRKYTVCVCALRHNRVTVVSIYGWCSRAIARCYKDVEKSSPNGLGIATALCNH